MEKSCANCRYSGEGLSHPICATCYMNTYGRYPLWKPSVKCLEDARKEIMDILHGMAKTNFNLEVFEKYDPAKPEYLTVNFVRIRDWKHEVVTTMAFDLVNVKITSESLGRIEEQIRGDLAKLNDGYYLENMDVASWYPNARIIKTDWENRWPSDAAKKWLNYQYGKKLFNDEPRIKKLSCENLDGLRTSVPILDELQEYCRKDVEATKDLYEKYIRGKFTMMTKPEIKKVIFNNPATIVMWKDGSKTVVKAQNGEKFDPEKGLAMAISKKVFGNQGNYFEEFKKWIPEEKKEKESTVIGEATSELDDSGLKVTVTPTEAAVKAWKTLEKVMIDLGGVCEKNE